MRLLFAVVVLAGITSAGVLMLLPTTTMPQPVARDGDVRDFGFGTASPVLAAPRLPTAGSIPDQLRLPPGDGRCLRGGLLSTVLVAGGWCGDGAGEELPVDARRIERLPPAAPTHPAEARLPHDAVAEQRDRPAA